MICEMADLGFERVELSHGIRMSLVPGILKAVEEKIISVGSLHNFCPLPPGVHYPAPNLYQPSAADPREREQWLRYTRQTMDFAKRIGASRIVLHLGSKSFFWRSPAGHLRRFAAAQGDSFDKNSEVFRRMQRRVAERMQRKLHSSWERTLGTLEKILPEAAAEGITLGVENRESFEELPLDNQFDDLFRYFQGYSHLAAWHDTGHAHLKERFGFLDHRSHLVKNKDRLVGFHLHDVQAGGKDHQEVGTGEIDFGMVVDFLQPGQEWVLELNPLLTKEQVIRSRKRLEDLLEKRTKR